VDLKEVVGAVAKASLMLTVFSFGLRTTMSDVLYLLHRPGLLVRTLLAMFVITPILVLGLIRVFHAPQLVEVVLIALAISPVPPLLPRKLDKAGTTGGYGLGLLVTAALASLVVLPCWIWLLGLFTARPLTVPEPGTEGMIMAVIILPLLAGMVVRYVLPGVAASIGGPVAKIAGGVLGLVAVILLIVAAPTMWNLIGEGALGLMTAFVLVGLAVGHLMGSPEAEHQSVLAIATASRHPGIALALASANFPGEKFIAEVLLYLVVCAIVCIPYVKWQQSAGHRTAGPQQLAPKF
jgi:bile acid:Na+ symporter, BASS family